MRNRKRFSLQAVKGVPLNEDIVGYQCDEGVKSLFRSIRNFYGQLLHSFIVGQPVSRKDQLIELFVEEHLFALAENAGHQKNKNAEYYKWPLPDKESVTISLRALLNSSTNFAKT